MVSMRWGISVRISDDRVGAGLGVKRQERDVRDMIARVDPDAVIVDVYVDNDTSAYSGAPRKEYNRMLADVEAGRLDAIGAWHNDRLHRNPRELEDFIDLIEKHGTRVATVKAGEVDLATPSGRMVARQLGAVARYESEHKADRIKAKHLELAAAGRYVAGGSRPYGYRVIHDRQERPRRIVGLEVVPAEADVVREVAQRILAGETLAAVCRDLDARGIPTAMGKRWSTTSLARLLVSARIAGLREHAPRSRGETKRLRLGTITGRGDWPAIITEAQSQRLRTLLTDPARRTSSGATGRYLCTGLLRCGRCRHGMVHRSGGTRPRVYVCDDTPGRPGCGRVAIRAAKAEAHVAGLAAAVLASPEFRRQLTQTLAPDEDAIVRDIQEAEAALESLAAMLGAGELSRLEWLAARKPAERRLASARAHLAHTDASRVLDGVPVDRDEIAALLLDDNVEGSRRRAVVALVLLAVEVAPATKRGPVFDPGRLEPVWRV